MFPKKRCQYCAGKMGITEQLCPVCGKRQISKKESQHRPDVHHITIKIPIIHDLHLPGVIRIKIQSLPDVVIRKTTKNIILYFKDGKDFIPKLVSCGRYLHKLGIVVDLNRAQIISQFTTLSGLHDPKTEQRANALAHCRAKVSEKTLEIEGLESNLREAARVEHKLTKELESQLEQRPGDSLDAASVRGTLKEKETLISELDIVVGERGDRIEKQRATIQGLKDALALKDAMGGDKPVDSFIVKDVRGQQWQDVTELRRNLNEADMLISRQRERIRDYEATIREFLARGAVVDSEAMFLRGMVDRLIPQKKL